MASDAASDAAAVPGSPTALYPPDLQLRLAILVHRHGARTPVHNDVSALLFAGPWRQCSLRPALGAMGVAGLRTLPSGGASKSSDHVADTQPPTFSRVAFGAESGSSISETNIAASRTAEQLQGLSKLKIGDGECFDGQLTDIGKRMMQDLGSRFRELYISRLGLLPPTLDAQAAKDLQLRSTDYARTVESLQYFVHGLYPTQFRQSPSELNLKVTIRTDADEDMYPKDSCVALSAETKRFRDAFLCNNHQRIHATLAKFPQFTPAFNGATNLNDLNKVFRLYDTFKCASAHGKLPPQVSNQNLEELEALVVDQWARVYTGHDVSQMAIGRFVGELAKPLVAAAKDEPDTAKLLIFSGHDSTLVPLLSAFRTFEGQFPGFSSHVSIELFREKAKSIWARMFNWRREPEPQHYVRFSYNGMPRKLQGCATPGQHRPGQPTFCTLDAFLAELKRIRPENYEECCRSSEHAEPDWD